MHDSGSEAEEQGSQSMTIDFYQLRSGVVEMMWV
jgi:hypothetical protein